MSEVKFELLYAHGEYNACIEELEDLLKVMRNGCDISNLIAASRLDSWAANFDLHVLELVLEGNLCVSRNILLLEFIRKTEWLNCSLVDYHKKIKALSSSTCVLPFTIYLNSLYNSLWLLWVKGKFHDEDRDTVFDMLEECVRKVLLKSDLQGKHISEDLRSECVLGLLGQVADNLIHFEIIECLQLVEICLLSLCLFVSFKIPVSEKYRSLIFVLKNSWSLIEVNHRKSVTHKDVGKSSSKALTQFKFGFFDVNETTNYDIQKVYESLCIMLCSSLFALGYLPESADFLTTHLSEDCCTFLCAYIQAYISLQLQELDVSKLYILRLSRVTKSQYAEIQFNLLKGQHESCAGNKISAHSEFIKILPSKQFMYIGLIHIFNNLTASFHSFYDNTANNGSYALIDKYIQALRCFYTYTSNILFAEESDGYNAEEKILSVLHKGKTYKREDLVYLIGKEMLWIEVLHLSSDNQFTTASIAAKCYMEVLHTYYKRDPSLQMLNQRIHLIHETVIALILSGKIDDAEVVCQILVQNCVPLKEAIKEKLLSLQEEFLFESGVAALILIAFIKVCQKKYEDADKFLTRVKKMLVQVYFSFQKSDSKSTFSLLDAVIAKVYVLKAVIYLKEGYKFDAFQCCQKAIIHHPEDDIIEECMKIAQKIGAEITPPQHKKCVKRQWTSVTLDYLLTIKFPF